MASSSDFYRVIDITRTFDGMVSWRTCLIFKRGTAFLPLSISSLYLIVCLLVEKRKIDSLFGLVRDYWHDSSFQCARSFKIFMAPYYQFDLYWLPRIIDGFRDTCTCTNTFCVESKNGFRYQYVDEWLSCWG